MTLQPPNPRNEEPPPEDARAQADDGRFRDLSEVERLRLHEREPGALETFYELYFDRVYAYVRRLLRETHLAEDLTQEIFMHIHQSLPSYDPGRALRPWVFTIATNKVRDFWRSRRHQETLREMGPVEDETGPQGVSGEEGPSDALQSAETTRLIEEAVEELPDSMRATLVLRYFEGLSFAEIGAIVDRNEAAVRKRYSRALEELRQSLSKTLGFEGGA